MRQPHGELSAPGSNVSFARAWGYFFPPLWDPRTQRTQEREGETTSTCCPLRRRVGCPVSCAGPAQPVTGLRNMLMDTNPMMWLDDCKVVFFFPSRPRGGGRLHVAASGSGVTARARTHPTKKLRCLFSSFPPVSFLCCDGYVGTLSIYGALCIVP